MDTIELFSYDARLHEASLMRNSEAQLRLLARTIDRHGIVGELCLEDLLERLLGLHAALACLEEAVFEAWERSLPEVPAPWLVDGEQETETPEAGEA